MTFAWSYLVGGISLADAAVAAGWGAERPERHLERLDLPKRMRGEPPVDLGDRVRQALADPVVADPTTGFDQWVCDVSWWAQQQPALAAAVLDHDPEFAVAGTARRPPQQNVVPPAGAPVSRSAAHQRWDGGGPGLPQPDEAPTDAFERALAAAHGKPIMVGGTTVAWCRICNEPRVHRYADEPSCARCMDSPGEGRHGAVAAFEGRCGCERCAAEAAQVWEMVALRMAGVTMDAIGVRYGLPPQRVRQRTELAAPYRPWDAARDGQQADLDAYEFFASLRKVVQPYIVSGLGDRSGEASAGRVDGGGPRSGLRRVRVGSVAWAALVAMARHGWMLADEVDRGLVDEFVVPYLPLVGFDPRPVVARQRPSVRKLFGRIVEVGRVPDAASQVGMSERSARRLLGALCEPHERSLLTGGAHLTFATARTVAHRFDAGAEAAEVAAEVGMTETSVVILDAFHRSHPVGGTTDPDDLPLPDVDDESVPVHLAIEQTRVRVDGGALEAAIDTAGSVAAAAEALGVSEATLVRWRRAHQAGHDGRVSPRLTAGQRRLRDDHEVFVDAYEWAGRDVGLLADRFCLDAALVAEWRRVHGL